MRRWLPIVMAILAIGTLLLPPTPRLVWNASGSMPRGLYALRSVAELRPGMLVAIRPPASLASYLAGRGYLPTGIPLLKPVAALPGQRVCRTGRRISIDGLAIGMARSHDSRQRPLPVWQGCRVLRPDEVFLMNPTVPDSLDSRYFGPLPMVQILGEALPLWLTEP
ncbi:S26 family signal peptidase [Niveispirillum sp. KHB5.9]|uniref:S26 family signal peptidase n=1 Tax=Niveispirillum sp. KHB5.9 TaxID=3400269 RepID=UPI003A88419A